MAENKKPVVEESGEFLIRIAGQDIPSSKNVYTGLTKIKGVSWSISNFICVKYKIDRKTKIADVGKERIIQIEKELQSVDMPDYLKNRRSDFDSGESTHLLGVKLDMRKEFDIKRLKQIKSYRGIRHSLGLPVRGQRTRSHFRRSGIVVGVKKSKVGKKG